MCGYVNVSASDTGCRDRKQRRYQSRSVRYNNSRPRSQSLDKRCWYSVQKLDWFETRMRGRVKPLRWIHITVHTNTQFGSKTERLPVRQTARLPVVISRAACSLCWTHRWQAEGIMGSLPSSLFVSVKSRSARLPLLSGLYQWLRRMIWHNSPDCSCFYRDFTKFVAMWYFSHVVQQVNRLILLGSSQDSKKGPCV